ncbi:MAG: sulfite exporter TauE/SafE family protein [Clostridia bacterium]|nr:sulfite exporter TauE/SafE family protein [Clostridia bacterium]
MIIFLTGILAGSISSLGLGGGTILILVLSNIIGLEQHIAQATNLIFYIPTAIFAIIVNWKQHLIKKQVIIGVLIGGVIGAIIGSKIAVNIDVHTLKKFFGFFLAFIAVIELFHILKNRNA